MRDSAAFATAVAVAKGEGHTGLNLDDRAVPVQTNAVPVEAKHRAVGGLPSSVDRHKAGQVVVAALIGQAANTLPRFALG